VKTSLARSEFNIRQLLLRGAKIDALPIDSLPAELQDFTANLVSTMIDATVSRSPEAVERLRAIAGVFGQKSKDPAYAERWVAIHNIEQHRAHYPQEPAMQPLFDAEGNIHRTPSQRRAHMLRHMLAAADDSFYELDLAFVERQLLKVRSAHELAARLSLECGAFGDKYTDDTKAGRAAAIARVKKLYTASMNETTRKKEHARK